MTLETIYTHTHRPHSRLILQAIEGRMGVFLDKSSPYPCIVKCPITPEFVIPYAERSEAISLPCESTARWAYETLCGGDQGQSRHVLEAASNQKTRGDYANVIAFKKKAH